MALPPRSLPTPHTPLPTVSPKLPPLAMVVAQAPLRTKEAEITEQDSLLLTRNLLRIAIFNISYIRGLFPEKYFNDKSVPALEMKIKKLMPMDAESRRLIDWMEKGVYDALQKKYLKTLLFCICETLEGPTIEEYAFSFSYPCANSDEVSMNISRRGTKNQGATFKSNSSEITPDQMRSSACKMVRTLVQLMRTLDQMPEERTILMKLLYYDDVTPEDYEPPFFRCCNENEVNNIWRKNPLRMEVGHVNSKHLVLALKVKSVLDPCEDENLDQDDDDVSLGDDLAQHDDSTSDSEVRPSLINQYMVAPAGEKRKIADDSVIDDETTQDAEQEEETASRIRGWISSRGADIVELADILESFPEISVQLAEEIVNKLLDEGLLANAGKDSYTINSEKIAKADVCAVKEEMDMQYTPCPKQVSENSGEDHMYMKALYHALPMDYVTIPKLQNKLGGEANHGTVRKLIDKMIHDGFVQNTGNRKLGKRVIHTELTDKKLQEVKKALDNKIALSLQAMETVGYPFDFNAAELPPHGQEPRDGSTYAALHSIGSETTRTKGRSNLCQNGSIRSGQSPLAKPREQGNTPTSRVEPISSLESGINGKENGRTNERTPLKAKVSDCSTLSQDKRIRKTSTVKEPILQYVKRQKSQAT